jgi:hypothetical protein
MTFAEIRLVEHLIETAHEIADIEPGWASGNWRAFEMVMRHNRPADRLFEVTDVQFEHCLRQAWSRFKS